MASESLYDLFLNHMKGYEESRSKYVKLYKETNELYRKEFNEIDKKYPGKANKSKRDSAKYNKRMDRFYEIIKDPNEDFDVDDLRRVKKF